MTALTETNDLTHFSDAGRARMVDVSAKADTQRVAIASGVLRLQPATLARIRAGQIAKGDVLTVADVAAVMAAKRTPDLIPMCHPIAVHGVAVELTVDDGLVEVSATVKTADRTGVEMEALTAVTVACLTIIDMTKALDPAATIEAVQVQSKTGGKSGDWHR